jgi:precorrin-2/cobalt-factor-2 C20-methyltransferase
MSAEPGRLFGLGVGPGDPELLTLKALRRLREAAVIAYPAPEQGESLARATVAQWLGDGRPEITIRFPMRPGPPPLAVYDSAAATLAAELGRSRDVALLCEGDPLFYGSLIGLLAHLAERFPVEIVPGVSSLSAGAAAAAIPLAAGNESMAVVPATLAAAELENRLAGADTIAILKLGRHLEKVRQVLGRLGLLAGAVYIERATTRDERVAPLAEVTTAPYFSMAIVRRARYRAGGKG